jgi:hypothetical protein
MPDWDKKLEQDLEWREAELIALKLQTIEADEDTIRYKALLRALWAMLYAHYEGFCKFALDTYLDALTELKPLHMDCKDQIAALSMQNQFKELSGDLSNENCASFIHEFSSILNQPVKFDFEFAIQGNLPPRTLLSNYQCVCLPTNPVENNQRKLAALVSRRNDIAHGKDVPVKDFTEYQEHEDVVFTVIYDLAIAIIEALEQKQYLKVTE